jgi:hypothetical protein
VQRVFKVKHRSNERGSAARPVPPSACVSDCLITGKVILA